MREIREGENPRERETEQKRDEEGREAVTRRPRWCDSGGQNQNSARQYDSGGAQADFWPIVENPRVAGGSISVAVVCETRETQ
jgi:hypothetical protein